MQKIIEKYLELEKVDAKEPSKCRFEIQKVEFNKITQELKLALLSNFVMPVENLEKIKKHIASDVPGISRVIFSFTYEKLLESKKEPKKQETALPFSTNEKKRYTSKANNIVVKIKDLSLDMGSVAIEGNVIKKEIRKTKNNRTLLIIVITDFSESICVKYFLSGDKAKSVIDSVDTGVKVRVNGSVLYDNYEHSNIIMGKSIDILDKAEQQNIRKDNSEEKRVELHAHTKMSAMDGLPDVKALVEKAAEWGHKAIAITDHGVVQAFPEAMKAAKKSGIKIIYGMEGYLIDDVKNDDKEKFDIDDEYIVFDLETTGLSAFNNEIIEIGAVRVINRKITESFHSMVKPIKGMIPYEITKITGITNEMVMDAPILDEVLPKFLEFVSDKVLVAHNSSFDMSFMREACKDRSIHFHNKDIDTLYLSRLMLKNLKKHKLDIVATHFGIEQANHHRAVDDAKTAACILIKLYEMLEEAGIRDVNHADEITGEGIDYKSKPTNHIILLAQNEKGLRNLYKMVSMSHIDYFYKKPRIPKSVLTKFRDGVLIGGACQDGQIFQSILNRMPEEEVVRIADFYDYLEIQPLANNEFLIGKEKVAGRQDLIEINKKIISLGTRLNKLVVATSDVHYIEPEDSIYRQILMAGQGYKDFEADSGLYFRTTEEMLDEFSYLDKVLAEEIVIKNPQRVADSINIIKPVPDEKYPPKIEGASELLENLCRTKAHEIYGEPLPDIVEKRINRELNSIISNGYAVMYIISHKLVAKSVADGYVVGSRGSVGSSFAATMSGITEVNPLPPHYICPNCKKSEFVEDGSFGCGVDLPEKICPVCGTVYSRDGFDIPFEVFLGFEGDKEPDIDLNFAGEYQPMAHKYIEELFGKDHVFRAGTIGTVAAKTAYGFVLKYFEEKGEMPSKWEVERLANGCEGVRRTTGQHPGGIIIVPKDNDIHEFCPIQHPANDSGSGIITTHFDYHSIDQNLLKLDILGHDGPSMIRMLKDITEIDPESVPLKDEKVDSLFNGTEALQIKDQRFKCSKGSLGIPEFGTKFVRQMLEDTKPESFSDLVRIAGLSHGTDVWINNAQEVILNGKAMLRDVISVRDDIMNYLIHKGMPHKESFKIMENVRKGKGVKDTEAELMTKQNVPEWYIESCRKIQYMFPKAHAVAYVMMSYRIAYFKVYYPQAFYATFFTMKVADFNSECILTGIKGIEDRMNEIEAKGKAAVQKEMNELNVLEVAMEMYARGFEFLPVTLKDSDATNFKVIDEKILLPFSALGGLGENAAKALAEEAKIRPFVSQDEMQNRTKLNKTAMEALEKNGALKGIPKSNQLSFF